MRGQAFTLDGSFSEMDYSLRDYNAIPPTLLYIHTYLCFVETQSLDAVAIKKHADKSNQLLAQDSLSKALLSQVWPWLEKTSELSPKCASL
jgi:hypothetical protein